MVTSLRVNTERVYFIAYLFFGGKKGFEAAMDTLAVNRTAVWRLWKGEDPCLNFYEIFIELGVAANFILTPYPPEIDRVENQQILHTNGIRPFGNYEEGWELKKRFLSLTSEEQRDRIEEYCIEVRKLRKLGVNQVNLALIPKRLRPKQDDIDRLVHEFHYEINADERRRRIVEWFSLEVGQTLGTIYESHV